MAYHCPMIDCGNGSYRLEKWKAKLCHIHQVSHASVDCPCQPPFSLHPLPTRKKKPTQRDKWIRLISREDKAADGRHKLFSPAKDARVCSRHFLDGKPTAENPFPTENLGYPGFQHKVALFLMGAINNLPYVIVNSASNTLADSFGQKNLVGLVFGANVALSVFVKGLNTFFLLSVPFAVRYVINGGLMLLGLFGVAYAFNFGFALACVVVVGSTAAFGENVSLGMLSRFPSHMINAWSSGTGMAGLLGGSIYVLFGCTVGNGQDKTEKMHNLTKYAFLLTTPVVLIYWLAFFVVLRLPREEPAVDVQDDHKHPSSSVNDDTAPLLQDTLPHVYVFEYVARGCAAKVRPASEYHVGCPELYAAIQLCYQAGVFVSRSSVQLVKIRRVEVMTGLQFINMILWVADVQFKVIPVYLLPALMVCVGLLGGASYVNIFYMLLHDDRYPARDRELCINITAMYITLGIVIGTGVETALFTTLLKND